MNKRVITDIRFNGLMLEVKTSPTLTHYPQGDYGSEDDEAFLVVNKYYESDWQEVGVEGIKDE